MIFRIVGVGLGCEVGAVRVSVGGEEVAAGGVVVGCNWQDVRCRRQDGGSPCLGNAGEGVVGVVGGFASGFGGEQDAVSANGEFPRRTDPVTAPNSGNTP